MCNTKVTPQTATAETNATATDCDSYLDRGLTKPRKIKPGQAQSRSVKPSQGSFFPLFSTPIPQHEKAPEDRHTPKSSPSFALKNTRQRHGVRQPCGAFKLPKALGRDANRTSPSASVRGLFFQHQQSPRRIRTRQLTAVRASFPGLPQTENIDAVSRKILFRIARISLRPLHCRPNRFQQIGVGPIVAFHQRPQRDDRAVDVLVIPDARFVLGETSVKLFQVGRVLELFCHARSLFVPHVLSVLWQQPKMPANQSHTGETARFRIGIEHDRSRMPHEVRGLVQDAVDPIAELHNFDAAKMAGHDERRLQDGFEVEILFDRKTGKSAVQHFCNRMIEAGKPSNVLQELAATVVVQWMSPVNGKARDYLLKRSFAQGVAKDFVHRLPCLAGLERAAARILVLGVFGFDDFVEGAEPNLDVEGFAVEGCLLESRELFCVLDCGHARKLQFRFALGNGDLILILVFHSDIVAKPLGHKLSKWKKSYDTQFQTQVIVEQ
jgi:hypothetical protein